MANVKKKAKAKPVAKSKSKPSAKKKVAASPKKAVKKSVKKPAAKPAKKVVVAKPKKASKPQKKTVVAKVAKPKTAKPVKAKKAVKPAIKNKLEKVKKNVTKPVSRKEASKTGKKKVEKVVAPVSKQPKSVKAVPHKEPKIKANQPVAAEKTAKITYDKPTEPVKSSPQLRYSDEELKEFKELIEEKLRTARAELKNLKDTLDNHTESQAGNKAWNMEDGTDTSEMEYMMNQISRQHQFIRNLELALIRVENKTYGICRVSGKLIPKERLRVVPHATLSLEAKVNRKKDETSPGASAVSPPSDFAEGFDE